MAIAHWLYCNRIANVINNNQWSINWNIQIAFVTCPMSMQIIRCGWMSWKSDNIKTNFCMCIVHIAIDDIRHYTEPNVSVFNFAKWNYIRQSDISSNNGIIRIGIWLFLKIYIHIVYNISANMDFEQDSI